MSFISFLSNKVRQIFCKKFNILYKEHGNTIGEEASPPIISGDAKITEIMLIS
jgi:hypothetical protein